MSLLLGAPPYEALVEAWKGLRAQGGLTVREVACVGVARTLLVAESGTGGKPLVSLSAGVHGDEPAAPWALLSLVRDGLLDSRFAYRMWPCTNPTGYALGTRANAEGQDINRSFDRGGRTPESRAIVTANRDRTYAMSLDLHEDCDAGAFYLYENVMDQSVSLSAPVARAVEDAGFPLEEFDRELDFVYSRESGLCRFERGRALPRYPESFAQFEDGDPFSVYVLRKGITRHALTFETPRTSPWDDRIAMHRVAVIAALDRLLQLTSAASEMNGTT